MDKISDINQKFPKYFVEGEISCQLLFFLHSLCYAATCWLKDIISVVLLRRFLQPCQLYEWNNLTVLSEQSMFRHFVMFYLGHFIFRFAVRTKSGFEIKEMSQMKEYELIIG